MNKPIKTAVDINWEQIEGSGMYPSSRYSSGALLHKGSIWLVCGAGPGIGKTSQVWKYSLTDYKWTMIECDGDVPCSRDGHSINYIGDHKIILFGGQGSDLTPNTKIGRQMDKSRSLCLGIREVLNDVYIYDIDTEEWKQIVVGGTFFPAGRRGHSCVYIGNIHSPTTANDALVKNMSLIMFGGAGFEIGKYAEQIYNDTWIYSIPGNKWDRIFPRGEIPRACYDHRAELVGENMVVVGGILGPSKSSTLNGVDNSSPSSVLLLNVMTLTWTYLRVSSPTGHVVYLNIHGHSMARFSRSNQSKLIIFGGKESPDLKRANEINQYSAHNTSTYTWELDLKRAVLTAIQPVTSAEESPENRCGQFGISAIPASELLRMHEKMLNKDTDSLELSMDTASDFDGFSTGLMKNSLEISKTLFYMFGGTRVSDTLGGYCDPVMYQLTATPKTDTLRSPRNIHRNPLLGRRKQLRAVRNQDILVYGDPGGVARAPSDSLHTSGHRQRAHGQINTHNPTVPEVLPLIMSPISQQSVITEHSSLWESKLAQNRMAYRAPTGWGELKLALMKPVSKRTLISLRNSNTANSKPMMDTHKNHSLDPKLKGNTLRKSYGTYESISSIFSPHDMEEFYKTGQLLEHSRELFMLPPDFNKREYMNLPIEKRDQVVANHIANTLESKVRGMTIHRAKKEYFKEFPPPPYARNKDIEFTNSLRFGSSSILSLDKNSNS